MAEVNWSLGAITDIDRIAAYIEPFDPAAARKIVIRLYALGESLCDFPHRGRQASNGTRELVTVPPFILTYDVTDTEVTILTVRHGRQRPR